VSDEVKLLPCPFCGCSAYETREKGPTGEKYALIECGGCGACIGFDESWLDDDEPRVADMWNNRVLINLAAQPESDGGGS
jgi:Lar family restriction alleviation protein